MFPSMPPLHPKLSVFHHPPNTSRPECPGPQVSRPPSVPHPNCPGPRVFQKITMSSSIVTPPPPVPSHPPEHPIIQPPPPPPPHPTFPLSLTFSEAFCPDCPDCVPCWVRLFRISGLWCRVWSMECAHCQQVRQ